MKNKNNIKKGFTGMAMLALGLVAVGGYIYSPEASAQEINEGRLEHQMVAHNHGGFEKPDISDEDKQVLRELRMAGDYEALQKKWRSLVLENGQTNMPEEWR